jgi:hypothetical protein
MLGMATTKVFRRMKAGMPWERSAPLRLQMLLTLEKFRLPVMTFHSIAQCHRFNTVCSASGFLVLRCIYPYDRGEQVLRFGSRLYDELLTSHNSIDGLRSMCVGLQETGHDKL